MREKKKKNKGDLVSVRLSSSESDEVVAWINNQANLMDSIRFLIEKEIVMNGNRNLQSTVPSYRDFKWVIQNLHSHSDEVKAYVHATYQLGLISSPRSVQEERFIDRDVIMNESTDRKEPEEENFSPVPPSVDSLTTEHEKNSPIEKGIEEDKDQSKKADLGLSEEDAAYWQ